MFSQRRWLLSWVFKDKYESGNEAEREKGTPRGSGGPSDKEATTKTATVVLGKRGRGAKGVCKGT